MEVISDVFLNVDKTLSIGYIIDSNASLGVPKIALLHTSELFLASCVPHLNLDWDLVHRYDFAFKVQSDRTFL